MIIIRKDSEGGHFNIITVYLGFGMIKIRRWWDHLFFIRVYASKTASSQWSSPLLFQQVYSPTWIFPAMSATVAGTAPWLRMMASTSWAMLTGAENRQIMRKLCCLWRGYAAVGPYPWTSQKGWVPHPWISGANYFSLYGTHCFLTHWRQGHLDAILKLQFSFLFYWLVSSDLLMIMHPDECHGTSRMISQHWFQVVAWCRQATSHYLSQCWPSSTSPYGVTRPQWVNENMLTTPLISLIQNNNMQLSFSQSPFSQSLTVNSLWPSDAIW